MFPRLVLIRTTVPLTSVSSNADLRSTTEDGPLGTPMVLEIGDADGDGQQRAGLEGFEDRAGGEGAAGGGRTTGRRRVGGGGGRHHRFLSGWPGPRAERTAGRLNTSTSRVAATCATPTQGDVTTFALGPRGESPNAGPSSPEGTL
jgi:hypothetical protein